MLFRKIVSLVTAAIFFCTFSGVGFAETPDTVQDKLILIETDTYGQAQTGAVMDRISKLEMNYNGKNNTGSMMSRVDSLYDEIYNNDAGPSVLAQLNSIEWNISHEVSLDPVQDRLAEMEMLIDGKTNDGTFYQRIVSLSKSSFGTATLPLVKTLVPANTLVRIALVTPVNAKNLKVGDTIKYKVASDVVVDGKLVFAKGEPGEGHVTKVTQARNFGRNAEVNIDFEYVKSIDGTNVNTFVGEEAKQEMTNLAMAAGASLAGIVLLGPVGIIAGAFVKGKNIDLPEGTEAFIQTHDDTMLYGVETTLAAEE